MQNEHAGNLSGDPLPTSLNLVRQVQKGDRQALDALFKRYAARVLQIVRCRLGVGLRARLESQDIVQEAFLRALKDFQKFEIRHEGAFLHWISKLVTNVIRDRNDYFHAQKRAMSKDQPLSQARADASHATADIPGPDKTPSQFLVLDEDFQRLLAAMDLLNADSREAVVQRDLEGLSFAEIGELLGRSDDAARMLYARAKARLAGLMQDS